VFLKEASCGDGRTEVEGSALESGLHIAAAYFLFETSRHPNIYFFDEDATKDEDGREGPINSSKGRDYSWELTPQRYWQQTIRARLNAKTMMCLRLRPSSHHLRRVCWRQQEAALLQQQLRQKSTQVRVIITRDLPEGQKRGIYAGEVHHVAAGYARNYIIPQKYGVYATERNFERTGVVDPDIAAAEEEKLEEEDSEELKAADLLRKYLRNKQVKIKRNVDPNNPTICHPGHVDASNLRDKLSKQLLIDLEDHESIHIRSEPVPGLEDMEDGEIVDLLMKDEGASPEGDVDVQAKSESEGAEESSQVEECDVKIKQLGEYLAKITLAGGFTVPLKLKVERR